MASAFIGFHVSLILNSSIKLDGIVAHIDPFTQQMTLHDVTLHFPGQKAHHTPIYGVVGQDIADLQILSNKKSTLSQNNVSINTTTTSSYNMEQQINQLPNETQSSNTKNVISPKTSASKVDTRKPHSPPPVPPHKKNEKDTQPYDTHPNTMKYMKPTKSTSSTIERKSKRQQQKNHQRKQVEINGWANEDVNGFIEEEFDFQANLNMFDKAKVFAEIKESDETAAETLLVSLNRLPRKPLPKKEPKQINLLPTENVLDYTPRATDSDDDDNEDDDGLKFGDESDNISQTQSESYPYQQRKIGNGKRKSVKLVTVDDHILCPVISPLQMAHAEHECISVIGLNEDQLIENGGRGVSELSMKILGETKAQKILVLVGNYKNGAYGLSVARRLLNHGYHVNVCMVTSDNPVFKSTDYQRYLFEQVGGTIIYGAQGLSQLPRPDLVIDSMLGSQTKLIDLQDERATYLSICDMIEWTNINKLSVLSIDFPSGVDASTGQQHHPIHFIKPKWTVSLAAPKTGCISRKTTGELYVIDLGYPKLCWKKVGLKKHIIPWGTNFIINLNYLE